MALANGAIDDLVGETSRWVQALTVATVIVVLETRTFVRALTLASGAVVDLVRIGTSSIDTSIGGSAESHRSSGTETVTARVVTVGALRRNGSTEVVSVANCVVWFQGFAVSAIVGSGATTGSSDALIGCGTKSGIGRAERHA